MTPSPSEAPLSETDLSEIRAIQAAADAAMIAVIDYLHSVSQPTAEAAHALIDEVLEQYDAHSPEGHIVAGGTASAEPHEHGTGTILPHTPIVIDIYPQSRTTGWWADISRTICLGTPPAELVRLYQTVQTAQSIAIKAVRPGVTGGALHQLAEEHFESAGYTTGGTGKEFTYAEGFVHSLGHGVGQSIHMHPHISRDSTDILQAGDIITIEPGLYYPTIGGVRLEDILVVTETGYANLAAVETRLTR